MSVRSASVLSLFLTAVLFLASCMAAVSTGKKNETDESLAGSSAVPPVGPVYGYEVPEGEEPSSSDASGNKVSANKVASTPDNKSNPSSTGGSAVSSESASSGGFSSAVSVPVVLPGQPDEPPDDPSNPPPDIIEDPVAINESVCYEWAESEHNILYVALQLQNTGTVSVEVTGFELTVNTASDRLVLNHVELKDVSNFTKVIEPERYGYIVVYYQFDSKPAEGTTSKSISVKVNHRPTAMTRKMLEIDALYFRPQTQGASLKIGFTVYNQYPQTLEYACLEVVLLDADGKFIGVYFAGLWLLPGNEEFSSANWNTRIFSEYIAGNLYRVQGVAYFYE
jgi:hypothetical protein